MDIKIDHVILGINDLEKGMKTFNDQSGVMPKFGGFLPAFGTHNALISLGNNSYLEIIAPQPNLDPVDSAFGGLEKYAALTPIGWALQVEDLQEVVNQLNNNKITHSGIKPGARKTSNRGWLRWHTVFLKNAQKLSINPFFIKWETDSAHPSLTEPAGCSLNSVEVTKGKHEYLNNIIHAMDVKIDKLSVSNQDSLMLNHFKLLGKKGIVQF